MKKIKITSVILYLGLLCSCSPKIITVLISDSQPKSLNKNEKIEVYDVNDILPKDLKKIGYSSLGDPGFTLKCDYKTMLEKAKKEARKLGADVIKITQHKTPTLLGSSCHRLKISLYQKNDIPILEEKSSKGISSSIPYTERGYSGPRFKFDIHAGIGFRTSEQSTNIDPLLKEHYKKLMSGSSWGANVYYLFNENYGLGFKYNRLFSSNTENDIYFDKEGWNRQYGITNTVTIDYIGPSFLCRVVSPNGKHNWSSGLSLGYMRYKNKEEIGTLDLLYEKSTFGMSIDFEYGFHLSKNLSLGIITEYNLGYLIEIKISSEGESQNIYLDEIEDLNHFDVSIALSWFL